MEIPVMEYISAALRGEIEKAAELSMSCVMCGICTSRCPAELAQYHIAMLCRRLTGKYIRPKAEHVAKTVEKVENGRYEKPLDELMTTDLQTLRDLYVNRESEPYNADEMWEPQDKRFI
jgi:heterodisulfide reductase subunit C